MDQQRACWGMLLQVSTKQTVEQRLSKFAVVTHCRWCSFAVTPGKYTLFDGFAHLASGLSCGLAGLAAGMAIGIVGDAGVRWVALDTRS